jgi:hypothetical protein
MLKSFSKTSKTPEQMSYSFSKALKHRCTVKAKHYCSDDMPLVGKSTVDGNLGQCPYCKRLVTFSERNAVKV